MKICGMVFFCVLLLSISTQSILPASSPLIRDREALYSVLSQEILSLTQEDFQDWEVYYLDVTADGQEEALLFNDRGQGLLAVHIVQVKDQILQPIPGEIVFRGGYGWPIMEGLFLTIRTDEYGESSGEYLHMYRYYEGTMQSVLEPLPVNTGDVGLNFQFWQRAGEGESFMHILLHHEPDGEKALKKVHHYGYNPGEQRFERSILWQEEGLLVPPYYEAQKSYAFDLNNTGSLDTFMLKMEYGKTLRLIINQEEFPLMQTLSPSYTYPQYRLTEIEGSRRFAFVFYEGVPPHGETVHFYEYTDSQLVSMGYIHNEQYLFAQELEYLSFDHVLIDEVMYVFYLGGYCRVVDGDWEDSWWDHRAKDICPLVPGSLQEEDFASETIGSIPVRYSNHTAVIIPMYRGIHEQRLAPLTVELGCQSTEEVNFAVFGTLEQAVLLYEECNGEESVLELGTLTHTLVTIKHCTRNIRVQGQVKHWAEGDIMVDVSFADALEEEVSIPLMY